MQIAVEAQFPAAFGREANNVVILHLIREVGDHNHIISHPSLIPLVKCNNFLLLVEMKNSCELPSDSAGALGLIQPKPDQVVIHPDHAATLILLLPINGHRIPKPFPFKKLLTLEQHWNPGGCEGHHSSHR